MAIDKRTCKRGILIGLLAAVVLAVSLWLAYHDEYQINWPVITILIIEAGLAILYFFTKDRNA